MLCLSNSGQYATHSSTCLLVPQTVQCPEKQRFYLLSYKCTEQIIFAFRIYPFITYKLLRGAQWLKLTFFVLLKLSDQQSGQNTKQSFL